MHDSDIIARAPIATDESRRARALLIRAAVNDVAAGMTVAAAARKHGVTPGALAGRLYYRGVTIPELRERHRTGPKPVPEIVRERAALVERMRQLVHGAARLSVSAAARRVLEERPDAARRWKVNGLRSAFNEAGLRARTDGETT